MTSFWKSGYLLLFRTMLLQQRHMGCCQRLLLCLLRKKGTSSSLVMTCCISFSNSTKQPSVNFFHLHGNHIAMSARTSLPELFVLINTVFQNYYNKIFKADYSQDNWMRGILFVIFGLKVTSDFSIYPSSALCNFRNINYGSTCRIISFLS